MPWWAALLMILVVGLLCACIPSIRRENKRDRDRSAIVSLEQVQDWWNIECADGRVYRASVGYESTWHEFPSGYHADYDLARIFRDYVNAHKMRERWCGET